jgi:Zn-dependent M28 family amino/carboxypeptidase
VVKNAFTIALAAAFLGGCLPRPAVKSSLPPSGHVGERAITAAVLEAPIRYLADDALEGRAPGTRGDLLARRYIAAMMQWLGLQPGAAGGAWEQPFELVGVVTAPPPRWTFTRDGAAITFTRSDDFVVASALEREAVGLHSADVVFVGFGIQAPEYQWDDFKGADLRGKVVLTLNNDPDWDPDLFAGKRRLYYGRWTYKCESAARQGAAGIIIIHTDESAGYPWHTVQTSWSGENSYLPDRKEPVLPVQAWMTEAAAARLAAFAGHDLRALIQSARERDFVPVALGLRTSVRLANKVRRYETANVLGLLPGRDIEGGQEVVVYSAHHDHLGIADQGGQSVVYNGALDNASGVAQLLAVARAFAALPEPPRRSILFLATGAEEQGLLGSAYFAAHPTFAPGRIMANINFDGGNIWGRARDIASSGYGKSTLDEYVATAAARQQRVYVDEAFPEQGTFYRSDQLSFAKIGVPALLLRPGTEFRGRPAGWGREQIDAWIARHYHQPSDVIDSSWNLEGMVEDAQLAFLVGLMIAETSDVPRWKPGDEFESVREEAMEALGRGS